MSKFLTREQYHKIKGKEIYTQEDCPFCKKEENSRNIVREGKYWYILQNLFPYSGNDKHIMAVPYKHKKYSIELSDEEFLELKNIQRFVKDFYIEENYFSCTRETMGNRSVEHLHIHFLPGRLQGKYLRKMLENQGYPIKQDLDINEKKI